MKFDMTPKYKGILKINDSHSTINNVELPYSYCVFFERVVELMKNRPALRQGQAMSIIIETISSKFADEIMGSTKHDPFYDDKRINNFIIKCFQDGILK